MSPNELARLQLSRTVRLPRWNERQARIVVECLKANVDLVSVDQGTSRGARVFNPPVPWVVSRQVAWLRTTTRGAGSGAGPSPSCVDSRRAEPSASTRAS